MLLVLACAGGDLLTVVFFDDRYHTLEPLGFGGTEKSLTNFWPVGMNTALGTIKIDATTVVFFGQEIGATFFRFTKISHETILLKHGPVFPGKVFLPT